VRNEAFVTQSGEKIRQSLCTMLTQAGIDYEMWMSMRKVRADPEIVVMLNRRYGRFYISAENAFFNSLITILYAAFEKRPDTVNFWNLRKTLPEDGEPAVLEEIDSRLDSIKAAWIRIGIIRNEVVGHQTLKRSKKESHEFAGMTFDDIHGMIKSCQELLVFIATKFHDTHVDFNLRGAASFENLILDLRSSDAFKAVTTKLRGSP
jgi:hypothetical protein